MRGVACCPPAQLASTEEFIDGQFTGNLGEVLIRCGFAAAACPLRSPDTDVVRSCALRSCNNVLYLRAAPQEEEEGGDAAMPEA